MRRAVLIIGLLHLLGLYVWGMWHHPVGTALVALVWTMICVALWRDDDAKK